jgi:hypothetical protein
MMEEGLDFIKGYEVEFKGRGRSMNKLMLQWPERWGDERICRMYGLTGGGERRDWGQRLRGGYDGAGGRIDGMVYAVYGLTEDEVRVIEPDFPLSEAEYEGIAVGKIV